MAVTPEEVRRVAWLARLELSADEVEALAVELSGILEHVEALSSSEHRASTTDDMATMSSAGGLSGSGAEPGTRGVRADEPGSDPLTGSLEELAPELRDGLFLVPRLASHEDGG